MKNFLSIFIFLLIPVGVFAYIPEIIVQENLLDITQIENPEDVSFFHGEMQSFPHTYEINIKDSIELQVEIFVPDIDSAKNNISGIIIKEKEVGGVDEVARLHAKDADWSLYTDSDTGNTYRVGPVFRSEIGPGVYRIEVSTPDNIEKYVLKIGYKNENKIGYFKKVSRVAESKVFFEKSKISVLGSRVVAKPLVLILLLIIGFVWWQKRWKHR